MRFFRSPPPPRRLHVYGIGTGKSGTHSLANLFGSYRSAHEPDAKRMIDAILRASGDTCAVDKLDAFLLRRDKKLSLEVDSSALNYHFVTHLVRLFPTARFILSIRDCYTWVDSLINHQLARPDLATRRWKAMRELRFRRGSSVHPKEERALAERNLYTLDGYLGYWNEHNQRVLDRVPSDRLLVVRTGEISRSIDVLACFTNVAPETLNLEKSHSFKASHKFHILQQIDPDYLDAKVAQHCGELQQRFFPGIKSVRQVNFR
jgi:hypothetical protein